MRKLLTTWFLLVVATGAILLADGPQLLTLGAGPGAYSSGTSPLLTNLIAYWELNEAANATAVDAHNTSCGGSGCDLPDVGASVDTSATAIKSTSRDFEATEASNRLSITDQADLSIDSAETSFTTCGWYRLESLGNYTPISKWTSTGNQRGYRIDLDNGTNRFVFWVSSDGTATASVSAADLGAPSTATWYFICGWHDASANKIYIEVNGGDGTPDETAHTTGVFDNTATFRLGANGDDTRFWDGLIDEVGFWKRVLTEAERDWLYNSGAGRSYSDVVTCSGC